MGQNHYGEVPLKFQYQSIGTLFLLLVTSTACSECEGEVRDSLDSGMLQAESADLDGGMADTVMTDGGTAPIVNLDAGVVGFFETGLQRFLVLPI